MKMFIKILTVLLVVQPFSSGLVFSQTDSSEILKAYEKRMRGEVEAAESILLTLLENDPANAMAHFEMARTVEGEKSHKHIQKALLNDPDNIMYRFYQANSYMLEAYKGMSRNQTTLVKDNVLKCIESLKQLLEVKPDCKESLLFLVEIYGLVPTEYGGNPEQAQVYLNQLKETDKLYAAQGELVLLSKDPDFDLIGYWKEYINRNGETLDALVKLGKAQLMNDDLESAKTTFNKVIQRDPGQQVLHLDVARAYLYKAMRSRDQNKKELNEFKKNINFYLTNAEEKPRAIEAWCYGWLGRIEQRQGHEAKANKYLSKAKSIMANYPEFTAIPKVDNAPNVVAYTYKSYFYPF